MFNCAPLSSPLVDFAIEFNEKIFLDPDSVPIDTMLKFFTSFLWNLMQNNLKRSKPFLTRSNITK